jgi:FMN phosphatase YigB (HAD superfamily)
MGKIKTMLSDAGGVLFDENLDARYEALRTLTNDSDVRSSFRPYREMAHTAISEKEAVEMFLKKSGINAGYKDYLALVNSIQPEGPKLFDGVTETLEELHKRGIDFCIVTNAMADSKYLRDDMARMLKDQLKQRGCANTNGKFSMRDYVDAIVSSKDIGIRKPSPHFFNYAIAVVEAKKDNSVFVGHDCEEVFGAANLGIPVIALDTYKGDSSKVFRTRINNYNRVYGSKIIETSSFSDVPLAVERIEKMQY